MAVLSLCMLLLIIGGIKATRLGSFKIEESLNENDLDLIRNSSQVRTLEYRICSLN